MSAPRRAPENTAAAAQPVGDVVAALGEGPLWDARTATVRWLDIPSGNLHRTDPATGRTSSRHLGAPLALLLQAADGTLLVARGDDLLALADDEAEPQAWASFPHEQNMRINDGTWDTRGRVLAGTMVLPDHDGGPAALWRVGADGTRTEVHGGLRLSNGVAWSPDGRRLYHVDTPARRVWAHEFDAGGELVRSRIFAQIETGVGNPDGLTVDATGQVWVALFGGWAIRRYGPDGEHRDDLALPVAHPTSCAFGGAALDTLFVTTASNRLDERQRARQPLAGRLLSLWTGFAGHPGVRGVAPATIIIEETP